MFVIKYPDKPTSTISTVMFAKSTTSPPTVRNIVVKIRVNDVVARLKKSEVANSLTFKSYSNFCVIKGLCHVTLIAFSKSGHLNITGVRGFHQILAVLCLLSSVLCDPNLLHNCTPSVVSSTVTGRLAQRVNLHKLTKSCEENSNLSAFPIARKGRLVFSLQRGHFPSLLIRQIGHRGCVQVFCSGKFNIVGCNSLWDIAQSWQIANALTKMS